LRFRPGADVLALAGVSPGTPSGSAHRDSGGRQADGARAANGGPAPGGSVGARRVFVLSEGKPRAVTVKTGISDGSLTEVVDGPLHEGDQIILEAVAPRAATGGQGQPPGGAQRRIL
jgi:HlyD family secretion protein